MAMLAACVLPFLLVESVFFITFVSLLNDAYKKKYLPKAKTFTRKWLPMLFDSTELEIKKMWKMKRNWYRTMGADGFTTECSNKVTIITESIGDMVSPTEQCLGIRLNCF